MSSLATRLGQIIAMREAIAQGSGNRSGSRSGSGSSRTRSGSRSGSRKRQGGPGKSAGHRLPKFHEPDEYMPDNEFPTKGDLLKNSKISKIYLDDYEMEQIDTSKNQPLNVIRDAPGSKRGDNNKYVKKFTMNGKRYTHWSMTEDGIQKHVRKDPRRYKVGDVILMYPAGDADYGWELYLIGNNQKLQVNSNYILRIILDMESGQGNDKINIQNQYPGEYEEIKDDIKEWIKMY